MRVLRSLWLPVLLVLFLGSKASAFELEDEEKWIEGPVVFPELPKDADLLPIDIGTLSRNQFFVDAKSVSFSGDGVLRYSLIAQSPSGVRNISYEGMRCSTGERRSYAFAGNDGWSPSRRQGWLRIANNSLNRQYAVLFFSFFCIPGAEVSSAGAAVDALRRGGVRTVF